MKLEIRKIKSDDEIRETSKIYIECWQNDYASFIPRERLSSLDVDAEARECKEWLEESEENQVIAGFVDGQMVGYTSTSPNTEEPEAYDTEISGLFMKQDFRGRGYGLALLHYAVSGAMRRGSKSVIVYNFKDSSSNDFYRGLGGRQVKTEIQSVEGKPLEVQCFGWGAADLLSILDEKMKKHPDSD